MTTAPRRRRRAVQGCWVAISLLLAIAACGPAGPQHREPAGDDEAWWTAVQEYVDLMAAREERTGDDRDVLGRGAGALRERLRQPFAALGATGNDNRLTEGPGPRVVSE